jgi:hypothetical protein
MVWVPIGVDAGSSVEAAAEEGRTCIVRSSGRARLRM